VPFALIKEERDGLLSTVSEYYVLYGEEKASVEGVFDFPKNKEVINIFKDLDLDLDYI